MKKDAFIDLIIVGLAIFYYALEERHSQVLDLVSFPNHFLKLDNRFLGCGLGLH